MKVSYISPSTATLELIMCSTGRPEGTLMLDTGIPLWPNWSIRVPLDTEDADLILELAFQTMAEDFLYFLLSVGFDEGVAKATFAVLLLAYERLKESPNPEPDGGSSTIKVDMPLDEVFVNEVHRSIVTAGVKRQAPAAPKERRMVVHTTPPPSKALSEATKVIQRYRNRSLKGQPSPLYVLVYNFNGKPVGVSRL